MPMPNIPISIIDIMGSKEESKRKIVFVKQIQSSVGCSWTIDSCDNKKIANIKDSVFLFYVKVGNLEEFKRLIKEEIFNDLGNYSYPLTDKDKENLLEKIKKNERLKWVASYDTHEEAQAACNLRTGAWEATEKKLNAQISPDENNIKDVSSAAAPVQGIANSEAKSIDHGLVPRSNEPPSLQTAAIPAPRFEGNKTLFRTQPSININIPAVICGKSLSAIKRYADKLKGQDKVADEKARQLLDLTNQVGKMGTGGKKTLEAARQDIDAIRALIGGMRRGTCATYRSHYGSAFFWGEVLGQDLRGRVTTLALLNNMWCELDAYAKDVSNQAQQASSQYSAPKI